MASKRSNDGRHAQTLHVYGPRLYHDDAFLVGSRAALEAVKSAIEEALVHGGATRIMTVNDDEGFHFGVIATDDTAQLDGLATPYWQDFAQESRDEALHPHVRGNKRPSLVIWRRWRGDRS